MTPIGSRVISAATARAAALLAAVLLATTGPVLAESRIAVRHQPPSDQSIGGAPIGGATFGIGAADAFGAESTSSLGRIGLAHVDLMDLHVVRKSGVPVAREILPAGVIEERFTRAAESGAAWNRWSLYWDLMERSPGDYMWGPVDQLIERDRRFGLKTLAILQGVPSFRAASTVSLWRDPVFGLQPDPERSTERGLERDPERGPEPTLDRGPELGPATERGPHPRLDPGLELGPDLELAQRRGGAATRYGQRGSSIPNAPPPRDLSAPIFLDAAGAGTDDPERAAAVNPTNAWAVFIDSVVERYRPGGVIARRDGWSSGEGVRAWEIGNEPNLEHFWSGTTAQYVRYLEVAYLVIQRRDPDATVLHGGVADHPSAMPWFREFLDLLSAAADRSPLPDRYGYYFDATAWHWYSYADRLRSGPAEIRAVLSARGFPARPLWVTEMGVPIWSEHPGPCWDSRSPWRATLDEQAAYVLQATAEGIAADVATLIHFQAYDDCGNGPTSYDAFGLLRNHRENQCWDPPGHACWSAPEPAFGSPRPAYHAFRVAAESLEGASLLWRPAQDPSGWQRILFYRPPNERVSVIWSLRREPLVAEFFGTGPVARVFAPRDGAIVETSMAPVGGRLRIDLPAMTNRNDPGSGAAVMAGHPIVVIETDTAAPFRSELAPLPERSPRRVELVARAADGGTGVAAVRLLFANSPPARAEDWSFGGDPIAWTADPLTGEMALHLDATSSPGETVYFALIAADRAGNWTSHPSAAQAWTIIEGGGPTSGTPSTTPSTSPSVTPIPSEPVSTPTPTPSPSDATPAPTVTASPTETATPWVDRPNKIFLPSTNAG